MALLVGRGKYLLQEEIGQGISGITYKAIHQIHNQVVVIKTFKSDSSQQAEASNIRKKFLSEAQRLLECSHPNIIPYREFFIEDGVPYIVMDYIPGKTLDKIVLPNNPLSEATAIKYIRQVGAALKLIHQNGLLHRDIKPQNLILRQENQQVVLIDFGIAREFSRGLVQIHTILLSDGYAPIEQYLPKSERTPATDIYGLAATLYTLVTAQIPIAATLRNRLPLDTPAKIRPELSNQTSQAIMQGMVLEVEKRPSSVDEWLALLPQIPENREPAKVIGLESNEESQSTVSSSSSSELNESSSIPQAASVNKSNKHNHLWKKLIIGLLLLLALDYLWLKFQDRWQDSPQQPNITDQR